MSILYGKFKVTNGIFLSFREKSTSECVIVCFKNVGKLGRERKNNIDS